MILVVVGNASGLVSEDEGTQNMRSFKGGDRSLLDLLEDQLTLLAVAKATDKPLVVMNLSDSISFDWRSSANALLHANYSGEAGGAVVGQVLAGLANPGAWLLVTF